MLTVGHPCCEDERQPVEAWIRISIRLARVLSQRAGTQDDRHDAPRPLPRCLTHFALEDA
jgi:hypothetical protein